MQLQITSALAILLAHYLTTTSAYSTWPSSYDELEDIMVLNQGYNARQLSIPVTPCNFPAAPGNVPAAGFVRTAFHDMAPHNAETGLGGVDASIAFELTGQAGLDNAGPAFNNTLTFLSRFYSPQASMSDLIALALYTAVRGCGGPVLPVRTGRKDAIAAGPLGVPKVNDTQQGLINDFKRMGFTPKEMVKMVACGHTLGGVHAAQFPEIVAPGSRPNSVANFDNSSTKFDNSVAVEFVNNNTGNPLVVGPEATNADKKVFTSDGGLTIRQMTDVQTYDNYCVDILQRMINTVPRGVDLTEPIQIYDVKPGALTLTLSTDGSSMLFSGNIRLRTTNRQQTSIGSVALACHESFGNDCPTISTTVLGTASGWDDTFAFYGFNASIDAKTSISSFDVVVTSVDGSSTTYDNNGQGFPVNDVLFPQLPSCKISAQPDASGLYTVVVVVSALESASDISMSVSTQSPRNVPLPLMTTQTIALKQYSQSGQYNFYKGTFSVAAAQIKSTTFDLSCRLRGQEYKNTFNRLTAFGAGSEPDSSTTTSSTTTPSTSTTTGYNNSTTTTRYSNSTTAKSSTSTTTGHSTNDYNQGWQPWPEPSRAHAIPATTSTCGASAGCEALPWATQTSWAIQLPSSVHGGPAPTTPSTTSISTSSVPVGGAGSLVSAWVPAGTAAGSHEDVSGTASAWASSHTNQHSPGNVNGTASTWNPSRTSQNSPAIATFTGAAIRHNIGVRHFLLFLAVVLLV